MRENLKINIVCIWVAIFFLFCFMLLNEERRRRNEAVVTTVINYIAQQENIDIQISGNSLLDY